MYQGILIVGVLSLSVALLNGCQKKPSDAEMSTMVDETMMMDLNAIEATNAIVPLDGIVTDGSLPVDPTVASTDMMVENAGPFTAPAAKDVQQALQNAGVYSGKVDGDIGPKTKQAIRDFQYKNGLKVDGKVGPKTWARLAQYLTPAQPISDAGTEVYSTDVGQ